MLTYRKMEWTREKTMTLINEYRKRRELWDMTHDDYRKKEQKQKYLVEVSKCLGNVSILEIEKKFHTLRTQYHREINRMKRKESYNSKWFGFKQLQFLSSPKACRSSKGRNKSDMEDGSVTTKYIISEHVQDNSAVSVQSSSSTIPDEFLTIHRKPANISYDDSHAAGLRCGNAGLPTSNVTSRSQELEKLIEETTKDDHYIEESKPKLDIKEIRTPIGAQAYEGASSEMETDTHAEQLHSSEHESQEQHHHHHTQDQQAAIGSDNVDPLAIEIQGEGEITYHQTGNSASTTSTMHNLPRIIKIQRRDTMAGHEDDYYHQQHQHQGQQQEQHMHTLPTATKRIYYGANGQHTATIIATTPPSHQSNGNSMLQNAAQNRNSLAPPSQSPTSSPSQQLQSAMARDEFSTYGEYVANEMRNLTNREILIALKHKINTALFEASMAELQK